MRQLDFQKIDQVLKMAPLCYGQLIVGTGDEAMYCAQGALLRGAGTSQERVQELHAALMTAGPATVAVIWKRELWDAEVARVTAIRNTAKDEIERILYEEYGLPAAITNAIPSWNDSELTESNNRAEYVLGEISTEAELLGLTMVGEGTTVSHDNNGQTTSQEASTASDHNGGVAQPASAPDDTAGPGDSDSRRSADGWTLGGRPDGQVPCATALLGRPALAGVGQASE